MSLSDPQIRCPELIGRDAELDALIAHLAGVTADCARTVLLEGEAGIGKSTLLHRFATRARDSGVRALVGECMAVEALRPFGPFVDIVRSARRGLPAGTIERSVREKAPELTRLLPELDRGRIRQTDPVEASERYRVHESFVSLVEDLASRHPLVIAIEDLHWADEATLELLPLLASRLRGQRILFLGTYRGEALRDAPLLERSIAELERGRTVERIQLRRLDRAATTTVIQLALGLDRVPESLVDVIDRRCEGNPFFIEEVLRALAEQGDLVYEDRAWRLVGSGSQPAIPTSVRLAVEQRWSALAADERRVIEVAAVIGQRFDFDLLRLVSGLDEVALAAALRTAIAAQLVLEEPGPVNDEGYAFRHALTREAVLGRMVHRDRRMLHLAVANALEALEDRSGRHEEMAFHFDEGGDTPRALRYHRLAGGDAIRAFAFARGLRHFERALELSPPGDPATGGLHLEVARVALMLDDAARGVAAADDAIRTFEAAGDVERTGEAILVKAGCQWALGRTAEQIALTEHARTLLEPLGDSPALAAAYAQLALKAGDEDHPEKELSLARRALAMARRTGNWRAQVRALESLGMSAAATADGDGVAYGRESVAVALEHGLVSEAQAAYVQLAASMELAGSSVVEAEALRDERIAHAHRHGFRPAQFIGLESGLAIRTGDWDAAIRLVAEMPADSIWTATAQLEVAMIITARHGPERGRALMVDPMRRLDAAAPLAQWKGAVVKSACRFALLAGDARGTLDRAEALAGLLEGGSPLQARSHTAIHALIAARRLGDGPALARWIELAGATTGIGTISHVRARRAMARAERAANDGDLDLAIDAAAECSEHLAAPILQPWTFLPGTFVHQRRAELLIQRGMPGDRDAAAMELAADVPYLQRARATWFLAQLRAWAAERDLPFPVSDGETAATATVVQAGPPLTARERQVAILVAQGSSNRAIAVELAISERTAEGHVEQVRNKLGFRSRAQIAAWVAETMPGSYR